MASRVTPNKGKEISAIANVSIRQAPNKGKEINVTTNVTKQTTTSTKNTSETNSKWSPLSDDIISISSRSKAINEEFVKDTINEYIDSVLYGTGKSRLPVFEALCREKK
ncbi:UNVERIFIED_CONTAM: hypothetical protein Sindi_0739100 [Sesamum indicum]